MMKIRKSGWLSVVCVFLIATTTLFGCSSPEANSTRDNSIIIDENRKSARWGSVNMDNYKPRLDGTAVVEMIIKGKPVTIEIDGNAAPITAGNFVDLVERGFYNGLTFHRVVTEPQPFVAQGGDPQGRGTGGFVDPKTKQSRYVPLEILLKDEKEPIYGQAIGQQATARTPIVALPHKRGAIAMARSQQPNSASSQFYFALSDINFLDGDYAVFGYVTEGMEVVDTIKQGDKIDSAKVISGAENLKK
jgi:peptidyl-prolyl cis-trans isomerase B (cyclophilin B)